MRKTEKITLFNGVKTHRKASTVSQQEVVVKLGNSEDLAEVTRIPFDEIAHIREGQTVYVKFAQTIYTGVVLSVDFDALTLQIRTDSTISGFMLFHQYGKDRQSPMHCWNGAWALTRGELL